MSRQQTGQDVDVLFDIRNAFYIGNYQQCINEAQKLKVSDPDVTVEKDALMYRSYIAQRNYRLVQTEINSASPARLQPLRLLAQYLSNPAQGQAVVATIDEKVSKGVELDNDIFLITAATIYCHEDNLEAALRVLHSGESLECLAYSLQLLLALQRPDFARRQLKLMQDKDDDATLTQLAQAWLHLAQGGAKLQDAYYICEELSDKLGLSPKLGASLTACHAGRGGWGEGEAVALQALDRDPNAQDLLLAGAVVSHQLGKPEVASRYMCQLLDSKERHPFIQSYQDKEAQFRRLAQQYAPQH